MTLQTDLNVMFLLLGGLSLVVGALGSQISTLVGVMERTARSDCAVPLARLGRHIAAQFLIGECGPWVSWTALDSSVGVLIVVGVSAYQVWTPVLDPLAPLLAPAVGGVIGLLSGVYPASRAGRARAGRSVPTLEHATFGRWRNRFEHFANRLPRAAVELNQS